MKRKAIAAGLVAAFVLSLGYTAPAAAQSATPQKTQTQQRETIYGYTMMSDAERNEYRTKMRQAQSEQERQTLRNEHRATMEARMKERGIEPGQMRGQGAGPVGPGSGMGRGGGPGYGPGGPGSGRGMGPGPRPRGGAAPGG